MTDLGSNLDQRLENEPTLMHSRMRNPESMFVDDKVSEQHDININVAGAFFAHADSAHHRFDLQNELEQVFWRLCGLNRGHAIEKPRLVGHIDRLRFVQGRDGDDSSRKL